MKKLILAAIALASGASVFAQGTVTFNNRVANVATSPVYGSPGVLVGTVGGLAGSTTFAQLLGSPGSNAAEPSLLPSTSPPTTFRTGAAAGIVVPNTATFGNILPDAPVGSFEMVVWDNSTGLYPTWTQASVAFASGLIIAGRSAEFTLTSIGGFFNPPPNIVSSIPGQGLQSFVITMPEPTNFVLAALGAAALSLFRRRK
jgi:hypothetical protein